MSPPSATALGVARARAEAQGGGVHLQPVAVRRRRKHLEAEHENDERWLLTYADMITLLLVLFIVLFAMSQINLTKFLAFKQGLTATFNPSAISQNGGNGLLQQPSVEGQTTNNQSVNPQPTNTNLSTDNLTAIARAIEDALRAKGLQSDAAVTTTEQGVVVRILADKVFFATDNADLGGVGDEIVDTIAGAIRKDPNAIEVQGYTDNQAITGGPYSSNWELSADRAANVANRLDTVDHIEMNRISSQGFGETDPFASNATPAGQAKNRRIDVVVLSNSARGGS